MGGMIQPDMFSRYRATSLQAYAEIKEEGLLSKMRFYVYDMIYRHQPVNISQLIEIAKDDGTQIINTGSISGRISELVDRGVIEEDHTAPCPMTGRNTVFWKITPRIPKEPKRKLTAYERGYRDGYMEAEYDLAGRN